MTNAEKEGTSESDLLEIAAEDIDQRRFAEAEARLRRFLEADHDNPRGLYLLSCVFSQTQRLEEAIATAERALLKRQDVAQLHLHLVDLHRAKGDTPQALRHAENAAALSPGEPDVQSTRGLLQLDLGQYQDAIRSFRIAVANNPFDLESKIMLSVLAKLPEPAEGANAETQFAVGRSKTTEGAIHLRMAHLWLEAGLPERANTAANLAAACASAPDEIRNLRTETAVMEKNTRAPSGYVRNLFDQFADNFDEYLVLRLGYSGPKILRHLATSFLGPPLPARDILDLGCGTGLAGSAFKPFARTLTGVDVSPQMLAKARSRAIYDTLVEADIEALPPTMAGPFDIVLAADVLVFFGDLERLFTEVRSRLRSGGHWLFTCERFEGEGFQRKRVNNRYRHSAGYLRQCAAAHGFVVESLIECVARHEAGQPVNCLAGAFRASGDA